MRSTQWVVRAPCGAGANLSDNEPHEDVDRDSDFRTVRTGTTLKAMYTFRF